MATTRQLALSGMLSRAVGLISLGKDRDHIKALLWRRWPVATPAQMEEILTLAQAGIDFSNSIDWNNPKAVIDIANAPRLPR